MRLFWFVAILLLPVFAWAQGTQQQTILFLPISDRPVNSAPFQVVAVASPSYLPVTLSVTGPATLNGRLLTLIAPGTVTVTAAQAGNSSYAPTSAQLSFQAQAITAQITLQPASPMIYGNPISASMLQATAIASPLVDTSADSATMERTGSSSLDDPTPVYGPALSIFRYEGTVLSPSPYPNDGGGWIANNLPSPYGLAFRIGFTCDCQEFEVSFQTRQAYYRLWVDGAWTSPDATQDVAGYPGRSFVLVKFPDRRPRQIKFLINGNAPFYGISTLPGETLAAPQVPLGPAVMIFGDSWTGPTILPPLIGPAQPGLTGGGYPEALGEYFNWNYWTDGVGGSGFTNPGIDSLGRTWVQRFATDVCANSSALDQLFILGTGNDGSAPASALEQAVDTSLQELDACLPNKPINFFGAQMPNTTIEDVDAAASASYPANLTYFDIGKLDFIYGDSSNSSVGNAYLYFNGHPTPLGHDFLAEALAMDLLTAKPALSPAAYALFQPVTAPGTFTYSVQPGVLLPAGNQIISATFTPADTSNYAPASASETIQITKALTSISPAASQANAQLVLAGAVAPQIGGVPTGTLQFSLNGTIVGSAPLISGSAILTLPASSHSSNPLLLSETYTGDSNFVGSSAALSTSLPITLPDFSFTLTAPAAPIKPGTTAVIPITFQSINDFTGAIMVSCSGLPAGASCALAGAPVLITGGTQPMPLTLEIVAAATTAAEHGRSHSWPMRSSQGVALGVAIALLQRPKWFKTRTQTLLLCAVAVCSLALSGCSSHSNPNSGSTSTPTSYTVQVTLAAQATPALTHTEPLTIQIQ